MGRHKAQWRRCLLTQPPPLTTKSQTPRLLRLRDALAALFPRPQRLRRPHPLEIESARLFGSLGNSGEGLTCVDGHPRPTLDELEDGGDAVCDLVSTMIRRATFPAPRPARAFSFGARGLLEGRRHDWKVRHLQPCVREGVASATSVSQRALQLLTVRRRSTAAEERRLLALTLIAGAETAQAGQEAAHRCSGGGRRGGGGDDAVAVAVR